ncbi:deacetylase [Hahella sp. CCB-MM4]|uniref:polysaccharide deacetylase family protein n=1 Tax=Hahella sp. (strain CCB-MM4) TaxID=1926491 RepID=UPI000B9C4318|nr:polysaccharide deacetylase family protein [Hahella sp. CCB-MM4]OZG74915.1 deacetylase [Hahella sp. CCB-MM4]
MKPSNAQSTLPAFLITIDTEGDNIWASPRQIETQNAKFLPRFQELCELYGLKPTYLTNYEMAVSDSYIEFASDCLHRKTAEIGMHLHAWNSPPEKALTEDDYRFLPYLIEYPKELVEQKIDYLTKLLEDTFNTKMTSHRAGRWAFDEHYAQTLAKHGYKVDCSVTPGVSWRKNMGDPKQQGGTDYRDFPDHPYFLDLNNIGQAGNSNLLELPVSILPKYSPFISRCRKAVNQLKGRQKDDATIWLRPNGKNLKQMKKVLDEAIRKNRPYVEFILHSSEFMPGGSPTFKTNESIEALYRDLTQLFEYTRRHFIGLTLTEFAEQFHRQVKQDDTDGELASFHPYNAQT